MYACMLCIVHFDLGVVLASKHYVPCFSEMMHSVE